MADNAARLTNTLLYHTPLIRRASSAISDDTSAGNFDVIQSSQSETSTPSSASSSSSTENTSTSSSSSDSFTSSQTTSFQTTSFQTTSFQTTSLSTPPRQPATTSSPSNQHSDQTSVQQNANTNSPPPAVTNSPAQNGGGNVPRPPDVSQVTTSVSVTDTSSKLVMDTSSSVSSSSIPNGTSSLTGMISAPSIIGGETGTSGNVLAPTAGSRSNTVPIIIGAAIGGIVLILVLALLFFVRQRRRRKQEIETLKWESVHDPADEPQSPLSSDSGHGLIETRVIRNNNLDGHVRLHWMNPAYAIEPEYLEPTHVDPRGNSPGGASTVSTMSSVTFARPAVSQGISQVTPTGHYTPNGSEEGHNYFDESWLPQSRKTRPSLMTIVHER